MDTRLKKSLLAPCVLAAVVAAVLALTGAFLLFELQAPHYLVNGAPFAYRLEHIAAALGAGWRSSNCGVGLLNWFNLDCRLQAIGQLWADGLIKTRVLAVLAAALVGAAIAFFVSARFCSRRERFATLTSERPVYDGEARASVRAAIAAFGDAARGLWLLPGVQLSPTVEAMNILAVGAQGSGKTLYLRGLLEQILRLNRRTVIRDAKGDMLSTLPVPLNQMILLAAHDDRSWVWDIAADISNGLAAAEVARRFVRNTGTSESFWVNSAQAIFAALVMHLHHTKGPHWSWQDLYKALMMPAAELKLALDVTAPAVALLIEIDAEGSIDRTSHGVLMTLWTACFATVEPLAKAFAAVPAERRFSIVAWLSAKSRLPRTIVLQRSSEYPELSEAVDGLFIDMLARFLASPRMPSRRTPWVSLVLDELPTLGKLEHFADMLSVSREKGLTTIAAVQDLDQLETLYGKSAANTILDKFGIKAVCRVPVSATRERISKDWGGERTVSVRTLDLRPDQPLTKEKVVPVVSPSVLTELGVVGAGTRKYVCLMIFGLGNPAIVRVAATIWRPRRAAHKPAAWLSQ